MLLGQVSETELQAGSIVSGAAMVALLGAPMFGRHAQTIRLAAAVVYVAFLVGLVIYFAF